MLINTWLIVWGTVSVQATLYILVWWVEGAHPESGTLHHEVPHLLDDVFWTSSRRWLYRDCLAGTSHVPLACDFNMGNTWFPENLWLRWYRVHNPMNLSATPVQPISYNPPARHLLPQVQDAPKSFSRSRFLSMSRQRPRCLTSFAYLLSLDALHYCH